MNKLTFDKHKLIVGNILKIKLVVSYLLLMTYTMFAGEVLLVDEKIPECKSAKSISKVYYLDDDQEGYKKGNLLTFRNKKDAYIGSTFKIKIYATDKKLISGCTDSLDWSRYREVAPDNNLKVVAFAADCIYHKPNNINQRRLQFYYLTEYADINGSGKEDVTKYYTIYDEDNGTMQEYQKEYKNYFVSRPIKQHKAECLNVELRYCGDGIVDKKYGEECDPKSQSYDAKVCDAESCLNIANIDVDFNYSDFNYNDLNISDFNFTIELPNQFPLFKFE